MLPTPRASEVPFPGPPPPHTSSLGPLCCRQCDFPEKWGFLCWGVPAGRSTHQRDLSLNPVGIQGFQTLQPPPRESGPW